MDDIHKGFNSIRRVRGDEFGKSLIDRREMECNLLSIDYKRFLRGSIFAEMGVIFSNSRGAYSLGCGEIQLSAVRPRRIRVFPITITPPANQLSETEVCVINWVSDD